MQMDFVQDDVTTQNRRKKVWAQNNGRLCVQMNESYDGKFRVQEGVLCMLGKTGFQCSVGRDYEGIAARPLY